MFQQDLVTVLIGTFGFKDELELALKWEWNLLVLHYGKPKYWKGQWSVKINWNQGRECCQELFFHLKQSHFSSFSDDHPCFSSRVFNSIQLLETIHVLDSKSERAGKLETVRRATMNKIGRFSKQDIRALCPSLSISSIEGALRKMVAEGELKREGNGKNIRYFRLK